MCKTLGCSTERYEKLTVSMASRKALARTIKTHIPDSKTRHSFVEALLPMLYNGNMRFDAVAFVNEANVPELM